MSAHLEKHEKALRYHREELQISESLSDNLGSAVAHRKIGECLGILCRFVDSFKHLQKYLKLAQSLHNVEEVQRAHTTIGRMWYMWMKSDDGDREQGVARAHDSFCAGLQCCDELEQTKGVSKKELLEMRAGLYLNLGLLAEEKEDRKSAEAHYRKAARISKYDLLPPYLTVHIVHY